MAVYKNMFSVDLSHTFVENDHEIISTVILLLPLIQEGLLSVTSQSMEPYIVGNPEDRFSHVGAYMNKMNTF